MKKNHSMLLRIISFLMVLIMAPGLVACNTKTADSSNESSVVNNNAANNGEEVGESFTEQSNEAGRNRGGTVQYAISFNPNSFFTPYKSGMVSSYAWPALEPLAWMRTDGSFSPVLADHWEVDTDNYTLTIALKEGIKFHNGDTLDAEDVVFTHSIREEFGTTGVIGSPIKIEAIDSNTVQFTWSDFSLDYEQWILTQYIYSKETYEEKGLDWMLNNIVGTGPYVMESYIPDVSLSFVRNDNYRSDTTPAPDGFKWTVILDTTATLAAFLGGDIDTMITADPMIIGQLEASGYGGEALAGNVVMSVQLQVITIDPSDPFSNREVREAVYSGVDWDSMGKTIGGPSAYHTDIIGHPEMPYYKESIEQHVYDLEGAIAKLAELGYGDGFSTTFYGTAAENSQMAYLQAEFKKMNIEADIVTIEASQRSADYITGKAANSGIIFGGYGLSALNPADRFNKFFSPDGSWSGTTTFSDEIKAYWEKIPNAKTREEQNELLYEYCNMYVNENYYLFPAYNVNTLTFMQEWYHQSPLVNGGNGSDPFEIWIDTH
ncbi:ABC transporter substrate-binding protein [Lachnospiraceae bacterium OttesenSCG-928-D06]|nr:ABC transporter substrate-binding protein [Lachnospiraceae bacterium OttesenSCG-928-D06]